MQEVKLETDLFQLRGKFCKIKYLDSNTRGLHAGVVTYISGLDMKNNYL